MTGPGVSPGDTAAVRAQLVENLSELPGMCMDLSRDDLPDDEYINDVERDLWNGAAYLGSALRTLNGECVREALWERLTRGLTREPGGGEPS